MNRNHIMVLQSDILENNVSDDIKNYIREIRRRDTNQIKIRKEWERFLYQYKNIPFLNEFEQNHG